MNVEQKSADNGRQTLADIRQRHETFYDDILRNYAAISRSKESLQRFIEDANKLIDDIEAVAPGVRDSDDRAWLRSAAEVWNVIFSTHLRAPRDIKIELLADDAPAQRPELVMPEDEVNKWISEQAHEVYKYRKVGELMRQVEEVLQEKSQTELGQGMEADRRVAEVMFALRVLEGKVNLAAQLKSASFKHLENVWLRDVKKFRAYRISQDEKDAANRYDTLRNYYAACEELRGQLVNPGIKGTPKEFAEAKAYLTNNYLDDVRVDASKKACGLVEARAAKLAQLRADEPVRDEDWNLRNWRQAETYLKMFYENIIPAATTADEEKTLLVLKAFQYSGEFGARHRIVNCFEVALAVYFLDPEVVAKLWADSDGRPVPASWSFNEVSVESWPEEFDARPVCGDSFAYDAAYGRISFSGVMLSEQFEALDEQLENPEHKAHLETLFRQSRLLPRHTTL